MNKIQKLKKIKKTENGDLAYTTTGNHLADLLFLAPYFEKHLDQVTIGNSEKEKLFAMFMRDARFGMGRRSYGRKLMEEAGVSPENIVKAGRFDDLYYIATDEALDYLKNQLAEGNELCKKWLPRLTGKDKQIAKELCKMWGITEKQYRALIKIDATTEYKLSYAESKENTPLNDLFKKGNYEHPLVDKIEFEKVPSLAMTKYLHTFSTRDDLKERFAEYMIKVKENKAKLNTTTANVHDGYKTAVNERASTNVEKEARDIVAKKIVDDATLNVEMDAITILDTSGSMGWIGNINGLLAKACSIAYAIASKSTYAKDQVISFSSRPQLMTIKGNTMKEKYQSMYTGDCSNTDFGKVMELLKGLKKFPRYLVVISDMEFDYGSNQSKEETIELFRKYEAPTRIIWWNLNDRHRTCPEFDEYGNIFLSGYNMQILRLLENNMDMTSYIDKIIEKYKKDIDY